MRRALLSPLLISPFLSGTSLASGDQNANRVLGEKAHYDLDRNADRTDRFIRRGTLDGEVTKMLEDESGYEVKLDYDLKIPLIGDRKGTVDLRFPQEFFSDEFIAMLRETGHYETDSYKIEHKGFEDATNLDGNVYRNCDVVRFYDVDMSMSSPDSLARFLTPFLIDLTARIPSSLAFNFEQYTVEEAELVAHVAADIPVIGAAKLDITGIVDDRRFKAGFDYKAP